MAQEQRLYPQGPDACSVMQLGLLNSISDLRVLLCISF